MFSTVISIVSVTIAIFSLGVSLYIYRLSQNDTSYLDIDNQYCDLLKLGLDTPDLRNYSMTSNFYKCSDEDEYKKKYEIYAFMCWNLVETIYDQQKDKKGRFKLSETWIPVMFEENRLHYSWFKHNIRLFKKDFQEFVIGSLNDINILEGSINDLKMLYANFERDFPQNERKSIEHLEMLMLKNKYKLLLAKHKIFEEIVGYALVFDGSDSNALWLDYMAIEDKYQDAGYGTLLFNKIIDKEGQNKLGMFMEVEIDEGKAEQKRRIKFYERLGAKKLNLTYNLPTPEGQLPMNLFYKPINNNQLLPGDVTKKIISESFNYIHTDIHHRDNVFKTFIHTISDEYLGA
ncbi:GNAT family N-acetyltransferase [Acidaminobacter sp. JC074]|uniref:GNAT family N-acetyltransferase n=1 Tax=Acidaminobacter sp. JC074 TaxID=2530199 RepID=UPI001F0CDFF3|nr:GNAT family N-acetyltransferase [Acidaminobacter sp. JC074]MCH4890663.1 GNAT family N-acetyltransferase [Acidaminobacter sp. JC074]